VYKKNRIKKKEHSQIHMGSKGKKDRRIRKMGAKEKHRYRMRKIFAVLLAIGILAVVFHATYHTSNTPKVSDVSKYRVGMGVDGPLLMVSSDNESKIPGFWQWPEEDWQKFQRYAAQTEVNWTYNAKGEKIGGKVYVGGEPLWNKFGFTSYGFPEEPDSNPVDYFLKGDRKGGDEVASTICYMLFATKGERVRLCVARIVAGKIPENPYPEYIGYSHYWVEWEDNQGNQWVIDYGKFLPRDKWYESYIFQGF
jgi:hypothetical protein